MLNIKLNGKEGSIALVSMLICSAVIIGIPIFEQNNNVRAVSSWLDETDADFNEGTLDNVEIDGTGSDAVLKLKSIGGYWEERVLSTNPKDRDLYGFAGVYNTDKVVVFGGHSSSQTKYNDTWIFDLSEGKWTDAKATASPAARHTMGMDGIWGTDRVLMFGGQTAPSSVTENDTWVYDLGDNKWTELFPNTAPSPVREHAIANFWGTDKVLTFGGMPINNETWLYDYTNNTWIDLGLTHKPPKSRGHGMATLWGTDKVISFGGDDKAGTTHNDIWVYDLSVGKWTMMDPPAKPTGRYYTDISTIWGTDKILLYGGDDGYYDDETWIYDYSDNEWEQQITSTYPALRRCLKMTSFHGTNKVIMYGGETGSTNKHKDTWIFTASSHFSNASKWQEHVLTPNPSDRDLYGFAGIYDTDKVIVFGGHSSSQTKYNDTWVFDLSEDKWTDAQPSAYPSARHTMGMDGIWGTDQVLLFGGQSAPSSVTENDTWIFDLGDNKWTELFPNNAPTPRREHALANFWGTDKALVFGGMPINNDTWLYDYGNNTWTDLGLTHKPPKSRGHGMATLWGTDKVISFGGDDKAGTTHNDIWVYDLGEGIWTMMEPPAKPTGRYYTDISTIWGTDKILLYGGDDGYYDDETWIYDYSDNEWEQQITSTYPALRRCLKLAPFHGMSKVIMYGGETGSSNKHDDTWIFSLKPDSDGTFVSTEIDAGSPAIFKKLIWDGDTPAKTYLTFQLRSADTKTSLASASFVGPDGGTTSFYETAPSNIWSKHRGDRWIQYKVYFNTDDPDATPVLSDVNITFNLLPKVTPTEPINGKILQNSKPVLKWNFEDLDSTGQSAFQVIIDDNVTFSSVEYDSGQISSQDQQWQFPNGTTYDQIGDGKWNYKIRVKDSDGDWGDYSTVQNFIIAVEKPASMIFVPVNAEYYRSLNTVSGVAFDSSEMSGIDKVELKIFRLDDEYYWTGSTWSKSETWLLANGKNVWTYDSRSVTWTSGKEYRIISRATDNSSNVETPGEGVKFKIDSEPPESAINVPLSDSFLNKLIEIEGNSTDNNGSGLNYTRISIKRLSDDKYWSGKAWQTGEAWVAVMGAGSWYYNTASSIWTTDTYYRIYSKAMDIVGNEEQIGTGTKFMYDNKAPTNLSIDGDKNNETNSTEYDLVLDAKDSGSGLWKMSFSTDTTSWSEWEDFSTEKNIEITKDDNFIYYRVNDKCGNVADAISFKIDIENKTNDNNNTIPFEPDPDKDSDDDGVPDDKDAFPEDPAASIDSDGDGYPDQWNPGKSAKDSTTGLKLDAYPNDPKKYAKEDIKGRSPTITTQMILAIVVLIIVLVLVSILFMMKPKKFSVSESDSEKMLNNLKEDIIYGKSSMEKEVTGSELRDMYNHNYQVDELSEESSEYIKNLIEESD